MDRGWLRLCHAPEYRRRPASRQTPFPYNRPKAPTDTQALRRRRPAGRACHEYDGDGRQKREGPQPSSVVVSLPDRSSTAAATEEYSHSEDCQRQATGGREHGPTVGGDIEDGGKFGCCRQPDGGCRRGWLLARRRDSTSSLIRIRRHGSIRSIFRRSSQRRSAGLRL